MVTVELREALLNFKAQAEREENEMASWRMRGGVQRHGRVV